VASWAVSVAGAERPEVDRVDRADPLGEGRGIHRVQRVLLERDRDVEPGDPERTRAPDRRDGVVGAGSNVT